MKIVEWDRIMQEEIVAYMLAYDQQNCYRGAKVRLVVKMRNGTQLFLNDVEYDSMTIAAQAFPDVLRGLNGDLDELDGGAGDDRP